MARIRTIKPEFFTSDDVCALSPLARLLFIACWCEADREGRMAWRPRELKRRYLPEDDCRADALADELIGRGMVTLYGDGLAYIPTFLRHQHINPREMPSKLPSPDACPTRRDASIPDLHVQGGREGKGKEGERKGKDEVEESRPASTHSTAAKPGADGAAQRADKKRGTRLTDWWQLTTELRAFAVDRGLDPDETRAEFMDFWTSVPGSRGLKLDWNKTFKNRCRELAKKPNGRGESAADRRAREIDEAIERSKLQ